MLRWAGLVLMVALLGCGQDKSVKKGSNEGLKIQETITGTKSAPVPEASKSKTAEKLGQGKSGK